MSNIIIQIRKAPYDIWEELEECSDLESAYKRLDELEESAIAEGIPSNTNNYRIGSK